MLVAHLPPDSATGRSISGEAADWTRTHHLLAGIFDLLSTLIWQNSAKGDRPKPLPRPGVEDPEQHRGTAKPLVEVRALLPGVAKANGEVTDGS